MFYKNITSDASRCKNFNIVAEQSEAHFNYFVGFSRL